MSGGVGVGDGCLSGVDCLLFDFLQMANTEEFIDGQLAGNLGEVLIRYTHTQV